MNQRLKFELKKFRKFIEPITGAAEQFFADNDERLIEEFCDRLNRGNPIICLWYIRPHKEEKIMEAVITLPTETMEDEDNELNAIMAILALVRHYTHTQISEHRVIDKAKGYNGKSGEVN
jgi:hypothetical protein